MLAQEAVPPAHLPRPARAHRPDPPVRPLGGVALNSVANGKRSSTHTPFREIYHPARRRGQRHVPGGRPVDRTPGARQAAPAGHGGRLHRPLPTTTTPGRRGPRARCSAWRRPASASPVSASSAWTTRSSWSPGPPTLLRPVRVVGWFQGRMEFGPRALGSRSILTDPRRADMKDILNKRIKHRETYRPFAPSRAGREVSLRSSSGASPRPS